MKQYLGGGAKWLMVGVLVLLVGVLLLLRVGRTRGTKAYRWRMALWRTALGLAGGTFFFLGALGLSSCRDNGAAGTVSGNEVATPARKAAAQPKPDRLLPVPRRPADTPDVRSSSPAGDSDAAAPVAGGVIFEPGERPQDSELGLSCYRARPTGRDGERLEPDPLPLYPEGPSTSFPMVAPDPLDVPLSAAPAPPENGRSPRESSSGGDWDAPAPGEIRPLVPPVWSDYLPQGRTGPSPAAKEPYVPITLTCYVTGVVGGQWPITEANKLPEPVGGTFERQIKLHTSMSLMPTRVEEGRIDTGELDKYLRARSKDLTMCFESAVRTAGERSGKVAMEIRIQPNGKATATLVSDTVGIPQLCTCLEQRFRLWAFPKPQGGTARVKVRMVFRAEARPVEEK